MKTLFLLLLLTFPVIIFGADDDSDQETEQQQSNTQDQPAAQAKTVDTFKPTEKLSKDIPATFPADI